MYGNSKDARLKEVTKVDSFYTFQTKSTIICEGSTKRRSLGLGSQIKEEVTKVVSTAFSALPSPSLVISMLPTLLVQGEKHHLGD